MAMDKDYFHNREVTGEKLSATAAAYMQNASMLRAPSVSDSELQITVLPVLHWLKMR